MIVALLQLAPVASATPGDVGLQAQITPAGFDFVSDQLADTEFSFGPTTITGSYDCYDTIEVTDFNLDVPIETVTLEPKSGTLALDVQLGQIRGTDMGLHGDSGWFDLCIDFDATLEYIELSDARLTGELAAEVVNDQLVLSFVEPPVLTGTFDSNIAWFPDDLVWAFMEGTVLDLVSGAIADQLPPIIEELTADGLLVGTFGNVPVVAFVDDVESTRDGLYAAVDIDLGGDGDARGKRLDLSSSDDSHLAVGLTEGMAEEALAAAWSEGLLSPDSPLTADLIASLLADLGLGDDLKVALSLGAPPSVNIDPDGIHLSLEQTKLTATNDGEPALELVADLTGLLEVSVAGGGIVLTAHEVELDVTELDASHLVDRDPENLQAFLEGWVVDAATAALGEMDVYQSHFEALGYVLRLDRTEMQDGGLVAWCTLFAADDPAVDREPPDTEVTATLSGSTVTAVFSATDDRPGDLLYSWRPRRGRLVAVDERDRGDGRHRARRPPDRGDVARRLVQRRPEPGGGDGVAGGPGGGGGEEGLRLRRRRPGERHARAGGLLAVLRPPAALSRGRQPRAAHHRASRWRPASNAGSRPSASACCRRNRAWASASSGRKNSWIKISSPGSNAASMARAWASVTSRPGRTTPSTTVTTRYRSTCPSLAIASSTQRPPNAARASSSRASARSSSMLAS
ncbi:MAG: hypothetical protein R3F59_30915 [Myxococcota bacterium]